MDEAQRVEDIAGFVKEFIRIAGRAVDLGLQSGKGGNISMRAGPSYVVKASGISLYHMSETDVLVVDESGKVLGGTGRPTKEIRFHWASTGQGKTWAG